MAVWPPPNSKENPDFQNSSLIKLLILKKCSFASSFVPCCSQTHTRLLLLVVLGGHVDCTGCLGTTFLGISRLLLRIQRFEKIRDFCNRILLEIDQNFLLGAKKWKVGANFLLRKDELKVVIFFLGRFSTFNFCFYKKLPKAVFYSREK